MGHFEDKLNDSKFLYGDGETGELCYYCGEPMHESDYPDNAKVPLYQGVPPAKLDYKLTAHVECERDLEIEIYGVSLD